MFCEKCEGQDIIIVTAMMMGDPKSDKLSLWQLFKCQECGKEFVHKRDEKNDKGAD